MTKSFGLTSYDDFEFPRSGNSQSKDDFISLDSGSNKVRLITDPYVYMIHKFKEEGDRGFPYKVKCSRYHGSCPLCDHPDKAVAAVKPRWYVGIIDRSTQSPKILDMSPAVFQDLQKLSRSEWGDPTKYDIDIVVDKSGGANGYYTVLPLRPEPLSDADVEMKQNFDLDSLASRCTPPEPDQVARTVEILREKRSGSNTSKPSSVDGDNGMQSTANAPSEGKYDFTQRNA